MNRRLLPSLLLTLALSAISVVAEAQCPPDAQFCGEVNVGPARARAYVRRPGTVVAQAPVVVRHPQPVPRRVVVRHRAPARVIVRHPAPRVIVVQSPPRVVHQPAPVYAPPPAPVVHPAPAPRPQRPPRFRRVGLFFNGGGILADQVSMGGFAGGLAIRPARHFGIRVGLGGYGGEDYHGRDRTEAVFNNDFLVYFNPDRRFQVYFLAGLHLSKAVAKEPSLYGAELEHRFDYIGGQTGLGAELRLGRAFALNFDARLFMRNQVRDGVTEFTEVRSDGTVRSTNASAGALLSFGGVVYF